MLKLKYHHVSLRVRSTERSFQFYESLFGYKELLRHEMDGGGRIMHLAQDEGMPVIEIIQDNQPLELPGSAVHLGFSCPDIAAVTSRIGQMGLQIERGPLTIGRETLLFIRDPDGYLIEINDSL